MNHGLNIEQIVDEIKAESFEPHWLDEYNEVRSVYLGSVFALLPSGKYYTPWACSNVEVCESCARSLSLPCDESSPCVSAEEIDGWGDIPEDYHCEACQDAQWYASVESALEEHGLVLESGEGDPCDLFVAEYREREEEQ